MMSQVFGSPACSSAAHSATSHECRAPMRCPSPLWSVGVQRRVATSKKAVVTTGGRRAVGRVRAAATEEKPKEKPAPSRPKKEKPKKVEHWRLVLDEIEKGEKLMVVATAPAVRVGLGEEFGLDAGTNLQGEMVTALRELGFNVVFDTRFIADVTIMEEGHELLARLAQFLGAPDDPNAPPMPMFSSCCPGWVQMVESQYPELIPYLSTCKSPQQMFGSVIKEVWSQQIGVDPEKISSVSVMPCVRKQGEADRDVDEFAVNGTGVRDVDHVITTKELAAILKDKGIDLLSLEKGEYDNPMGGGSGAGQLFGTTGGVMEAAIRTCYEVVTQTPMPKLELSDVRGMDGLKEANVELKISPDGPLGPAVESGACAPVVTLKIAVANGLGNAKKVVKAVEAGEADYHFVEVMACPGGCIGGGGQPRAKGKPADTLKLRQQAIYNIDGAMKNRTSHGNPFVQQLYRDFIGEPNGEKAHHLLHTHYVPGGPGEVPPPKSA